MAKRLSYRLTQGQQGIRPSGGGFALDLPQNYVVTTASNAVSTLQRWLWSAPSWIQADATVSVLADTDPMTEVAPAFVLQQIRITPETALASGSNNPLLTFVHTTASGGTQGTVGTYDLAGAGLTAYSVVTVEASSMTASLAIFGPGESIRLVGSTQGAGAVSIPALGVALDIQA